MKNFFYDGSYSFTYFLFDLFTGEPVEVPESEFIEVVGFNREVIPYQFDKENVNKQIFFLDGVPMGYRIKTKNKKRFLCKG